MKTELRTHNCGELKKVNIDKEVSLCGWVNRVRTHGGILFVDIRDRYGMTQVVFDPKHEKIDESTGLGKEDVIQVEGKVRLRPEMNKKIPTGEIEVLVSKLSVLNKSAPLPLDENAEEDTRLKYRYVDLRSQKMQRNIELRHNITMTARSFLNKQGFLDIETPVLGKSTPEGARDYLVPSRVNPKKFFALPQSPQLYKQLLMVSGMDRYFQIVKCFRDEDLRADRQPEFTQIDIEMSFIKEDDIYATMEGLMVDVMKTIGVDIKVPFKRMTYDEAMVKYGIDKPDLRFGMELIDVTESAKKLDFNIFKQAESIKCIKADGCGDFSRKKIDKMTDVVKIYGAKGLVTLKVGDEPEGSLAKFITKDQFNDIVEKTNAKKDDLLLFVADKEKTTNVSLGQLRLYLGKELDLIKKGAWEFLWVVDFPMFEYSEEEKRYMSMHHPFTSPKEMSIKYLDNETSELKSNAYDLVLNGTELGGGSIRIHKADVQAKVFDLLKISKEDAKTKFGFLLDAFKYGAPPHGGIAFGLDRLVALLAGEDNIREVIAFPKTKNAESLMEGSPGEVDTKQLDELHIQLKK